MIKKQEAEFDVAEVGILRFAMQVTKVNKIINEYIWESARVDRAEVEGDKIVIAWTQYIGNGALDMELPGTRGGGDPRESL